MTVIMYCLLLLQGFLVKGITAGDIPPVRLKTSITFKGPGYTVIWYPVKSKNESNPVIGYKFKMWETPCAVTTSYKSKDGQLYKILKSEHQVYYNQSVPQELPLHVAIVTSEELSVTVPHIDLEVWYNVRVLAFTKTAEGPYSDAVQFKLVSEDENDKKKSCERIISEMLVRYTDEDDTPDESLSGVSTVEDDISDTFDTV